MLFKELTYQRVTSDTVKYTLTNRQIINEEYIEVDEYTRIYYYPHEGDKTGFEFWVMEWVGCNADAEDFWDRDSCKADILYHGTAYFDGVRHMYQGDERTDNEGYLNYPDIGTHIGIFTKLNELQGKYCAD